MQHRDTPACPRHDTMYFATQFTRTYLRKGRMIRLETLIELKSLNSSFSSFFLLIEIRQTVPYRAIRGNSISVNSTLPPLIPHLAILFCPAPRWDKSGGENKLKTNKLNTYNE